MADFSDFSLGKKNNKIKINTQSIKGGIKSSALSDEKLTTAVKGTKAKVVKCGRYEIIDNIYSRWVQVEFAPAVTDKDGKSFDRKKSYWLLRSFEYANQDHRFERWS